MSTKGYYYLVLSGHLKAVVQDSVLHWRFAEDAESEVEQVVHPINHGDMLKVFDREQTLVWSGVVAFNFSMCSEPSPDNPEMTIQKIGDKVVHGVQGSARPKEWLKWFEDGYRARLEIRINEQNSPHDKPTAEGAELAEPEDPAVVRERLIKGVLQAHDQSSAPVVVSAPDGERPKRWWDD